MHAKASGIHEKDDDGIPVSVWDVSPGYWTLTGVSGDSRVVGCAPVLGNDVPYLWLTI